MTILGVDVGYTYTKTSEGVLFPSRIAQTDAISSGDQITIDGTAYFIGTGASTYDLNKIDSEVFRVCLIAAIAKSTPDNDVKIVVGLPIGQYQTQKEQLESMIDKNKTVTVAYDGEERTINIKDTKVYAQGAAALYSQKISGDAIIVDIGGMTTDIALFEIEGKTRRVTDSTTLFKTGTLTLYSKIVQAVNEYFTLALDIEDGEGILKNGLTVDGVKQDVEFLKPIIREHVDKIENELRLNYPSKTKPIYLCGGGSAILGETIKKKFPGASFMSDAQFANAKGFKEVGLKIWAAKQ